MAKRKSGQGEKGPSGGPSAAVGGFSVKPDPLVGGSLDEGAHKYEATVGPGPSREFEEIGNLPAGYGSNTLFLVARDPHWLFSYWDVNWEQFPASERLGGEARAYLKLFGEEGELSTVEVQADARNWYLPAPRAEAVYWAQVGVFDAGGAWRLIAESDRAATPANSISAKEEVAFATVPAHLTFEHLAGLVREARHKGESLAETLARLQDDGRRLAFALGKACDWTEEDRRRLEVLFGESVASGGGSEELGRRLAEFLKVKLSSEMSSEALASWMVEQLSSASASEWLAQLRESLWSEVASGFSARLREVLSSEISSAYAVRIEELLSSGSGSQFGVRLRELLSSEVASGFSAKLREFLSSEVSSGFALRLAEVMSSGVTSFWGAIQKESGSAAFASELFARWAAETLSSGMGSQALARGLLWGPETGSLFSAFGGLGAFASWGAFGSETMSMAAAAGAFSSFGLAGSSSWGGALGAFGSELTSWSGSSSWGGSPAGGLNRGFFMHVNAEVIFYGGTDPNAKVKIAGFPLHLAADGTFRFHFRLPDGEFEIPIVAESPDGAETRSATLRFERETLRAGDVGATGQPSHLTDPMGRLR
jgi:hypothetical protein